MEQKSGSFSNVIGTQGATVDDETLQSAKQMQCSYKKLAPVQLVLASLATVAGIVSLCLAIPTPTWPFMNVFPLVNGAQLVAGGVLAYLVGKSDLSNEIPKNFFRYIGAHYSLSITSMSFCGLAAGFSGQALGKCVNDDEDCTPNRDAKMAFLIINIVLAGLLYPLCCFTLGIYCKHYRTMKKAWGKGCPASKSTPNA